MVLLKIDSPPSRYPDRPIGEAAGRWWVAKVKPRQEKQLAFDLYKEGIEYYLPLYRKNTPRPGTTTKRIFEVPLFPGYICFAQDIPSGIFRSGRVVNVIEVRNQKLFITELDQVYRLSKNEFFVLGPVTDVFEDGDEVEIHAGPFKGLKGVVQSQNSARLIVKVTGLGSACLNLRKLFVRIV